MTSFLPLIILLFYIGCKETPAPKTKPYTAGFTTFQILDTSRIYKPNTATADYLHYRPVDADLWYPADSSAAGTLITVHDLLSLLEQRANYYSASNIGNGIAGQMAQIFCDGFKCSDSATLLRYKTNSFKNAVHAKGKFPLIIYMTAYNGMSYENFSLFEALAKAGFVVASVSSIGRFPGDMTMKRADLMEQVNDAVAILDFLKRNEYVDINNVGIVGYSWGGLAGAILAGKVPHVKCLVSLEGSEYHHYGNAKDENADFDTIKNSSDFKNIHLSIPYLRLESAPSRQGGRADSVYNFAALHASNAQIFTIDSAQHEDFDCLSLVVKKSGNCTISGPYNSALKLTVSFLEENLKKENHFSGTVAEELNKTIKRK